MRAELQLARVALAPFLFVFWWFVAFCGGPRHQSYIHARWRMYQESALLRNFTENGND